MTSTARDWSRSARSAVPSLAATAPSVPLPAKKSRHQSPGRVEASTIRRTTPRASASDSPSSRGRWSGRSCATRRRSAACRAPPSRRDQSRRHVRLAVDRLRVEQVASRVLHVHEDRVVLCRPAALGCARRSRRPRRSRSGSTRARRSRRAAPCSSAPRGSRDGRRGCRRASSRCASWSRGSRNAEVVVEAVAVARAARAARCGRCARRSRARRRPRPARPAASGAPGVWPVLNGGSM